MVSYDIAVARDGSGDYFTIQEAIQAAPEGKKVTIQILGGEWEKPKENKVKNIKFYPSDDLKLNNYIINSNNKKNIHSFDEYLYVYIYLYILS